MARTTWLVNSRGIARKIKNATRLSNNQIREWGAEANRECPNCKHIIDNSDVSLEWPGLPAGVKFDPSDLELLQHLAGKIGLGNSKPHMFVDEFIPTLEGDQGICYAHPENLPGAKKDGTSIHFFHRTLNAYATGHRKRRKINCESSMPEERVRWHKTGKTKPVLENGVHKGWKKIMVLYKNTKRGSKPDKANWVMHQYHLGTEEDEKDGGLVVSKIFYQQQSKLIDKSDMVAATEEFDTSTLRSSPKTPKTNAPQPPRPGTGSPDDDAHEHKLHILHGQEWYPEELEATPSLVSNVHLQEQGVNSAWWAGESQAIEYPNQTNVDESLLCHEVLESFPPIEESALQFHYTDLNRCRNDLIAKNTIEDHGFSDLDNIVIGTPPDFDLADLQFGSQDSITSWLDRL